MAINLEKGARINLSKDSPSLTNVRIGLGWSPNKTDTGQSFDLDASVFVCKVDGNGDPKLVSDEFFVFYGNQQTPDRAVVHSGDNRTGDAAGDDESITIDLAALNPAVDEISFIVTIHEADVRRQNFGQVPKSYIVLYDDATNVEIARYSLEDDFSTETAVQFGSLYKNNGSWMFKAVGTGYKRGLADFVVAYGGSLA